VKRFLGELDALLRGHRTARTELASGDVPFALPLSLQAVCVLGGVYGLCMGLFALTGARSDAWLQIAASALKVPALFLLTLVVTSPSLYVFSALVGSHLRFLPVLRLLMAAIVVTVAVSASLAPILAFFTLSSTSYSFMVLLNVMLLGASGFVGIAFLRHTLVGLMLAAHRRELRSPVGPMPRASDAVLAPSVNVPAEQPPPEVGLYRSTSPVDPCVHPGESARREVIGQRVFRIWLVAYAIVGAQMSWLLRPFIGNPAASFSWFRPREGSFFSAVLSHFIGLFR
jgi:hypothetical protein